MKTKTQKHRLPNESETSWKHTPNAKTAKKNDVCTVLLPCITTCHNLMRYFQNTRLYISDKEAVREITCFLSVTNIPGKSGSLILLTENYFNIRFSSQKKEMNQIQFVSNLLMFC